MASSSSETPISPVTTSRPTAINDLPVELDSTPISPEQAQFSRRGSKANALEALHADKDLTPAEREIRAKLIEERKADLAVLVDVPEGPAAAELERASNHQDGGKTTQNAKKP